MLSNLAIICRQSVVVSQIIREVDIEIQLRQERTKHACTNCVFFNQNQYIRCAVHPEGPSVSECEINDCTDWDLVNREVAS